LQPALSDQRVEQFGQPAPSHHDVGLDLARSPGGTTTEIQDLLLTSLTIAPDWRRFGSHHLDVPTWR
jgi:hypothetical protein